MWTRITTTTMPNAGERVLISNGETETIARYTLTDNHIIWFYDCDSHIDIVPDWWYSLPELPKKINKEIQ